MSASKSRYDDREMLNDALYSQKQVTERYNLSAGECAGGQVRDLLMTILNEEHQIQSEVFDEMTKRGWITPQRADRQQIQQAKQKYGSAQP